MAEVVACSRKRDSRNVVAVQEKALEKMPDNAFLMSRYAVNVFRFKVEIRYWIPSRAASSGSCFFSNSNEAYWVRILKLNTVL